MNAFNNYALSVVHDENKMDELMCNFRQLEDLRGIDYTVLSFLISWCTKEDVLRLIDANVDFTCTIEERTIRGDMDTGLLEIVISDDNVELAEFIIRNIPKNNLKDFFSKIWAWQRVESEKMARLIIEFRKELVDKVVCPRKCVTRTCSYCHPLVYCIKNRKFDIAKVILEKCPEMARLYGPGHRSLIYMLLEVGETCNIRHPFEVSSFYDLFELFYELGKPRYSDGIHSSIADFKTYKNVVYYALRISAKFQDGRIIDIILKRDHETEWNDLIHVAEFGRYEDFVKLFSGFKDDNDFSYQLMCVLAEKWRVDIYKYLLTVFGYPRVFFKDLKKWKHNRRIVLFVNEFEDYDVKLFDMLAMRLEIKN